MTSYARISRAVHWLVAALVVVVISLGWAIGGAPRNTPTRDLVLLLHRSVGLVILAVMVFRAGWRWVHPAPPLPPSRSRVRRATASSNGTAFSNACCRGAVSATLNPPRGRG